MFVHLLSLLQPSCLEADLCLLQPVMQLLQWEKSTVLEIAKEKNDLKKGEMRFFLVVSVCEFVFFFNLSG